MELKYDKNKIIKLSSEINNSLEKLDELGKLNKKEFLSDPYKVASAKYFLIVAIEAAIDMCNHVISKNKFRAPEDYSDTFRILGEKKLFSQDFVKKLVEMTRFRNRLVHIYWNIDDEIIYEIIKEDLNDLDFFVEKFISFLNKK